jgi:pantoate--beta-alanine ligase
MILFKKAADMARWGRQQRAAGRRIGFVPTMGALHAGHISLIGQSKNIASLTVCSIFVNPTQFNDPRDFQKYPITIENDIYLLERAGVDVLFLPEVEEMYPDGLNDLETYALGRLELLWEGKSRPGHFQGVCQVVRRLLENVDPDRLFMGQKDYQQCLVIRRLLDLMGSKISLQTCPIMREADGLAMSSRNQRLTPAERQRAPAIYQALSRLKAEWQAQHSKWPTQPDQGQTQRSEIPQEELVEALTSKAIDSLTRQGLRPDYISIADAETLEPLQRDDISQGDMSREGQSKTGIDDRRGGGLKAIALAAAFLGEVRLIDNLLLNNP